jgi:hypothetical protein
MQMAEALKRISFHGMFNMVTYLKTMKQDFIEDVGGHP